MKKFSTPSINNLNLSKYKKISESMLLNASKWNLQLWAFIIILAGGSFLVAEAIVKGNMRLLVNISLIIILGVSCLRIETGVFAILIYLPFMGILRRYIYSFNAYVSFDPILIIASALTLFMFGYIFIFYGEEILIQNKNNQLFKYVSLLLLLFLVEAFNPFQGGLAMGFSAIMFIVVPFLWFYFGFFLSTKNLEKLFYVVIVIGVITAVYGLRQVLFGVLPFEEYWIAHGGFTAIKIKGFIKAFSTFMSPQEFANYLLIASSISFMYLFKKLFFYPIWMAAFAVLMYGVFMTSTRSVIFYFFILVGIFMAFKVGSWQRAVIANVIMITLLIFGLPKIKTPAGNISSTKGANIEHLVSGVTDPFGEESTFWTRVNFAKWTLGELITTPFGRGTGTITMGSGKFGGQIVAGMEVFQLAIVGSCGIPGLILYITIIVWLIKASFFLIRKDPDTYLAPSVLSIWLALTGEPRLYSTGPFFYLLWGWLAKEYGEQLKLSQKTGKIKIKVRGLPQNPASNEDKI